MIEIICEHFCDQVPKKLSLRCTECLLGVENKYKHSICKLSRKEKVQLVFEEIWSELNDFELKDIYMARRGIVLDDGSYIEKELLAKNNSWLRKLKNRIDRHLI